jgi:hypothetical protein
VVKTVSADSVQVLLSGRLLGAQHLDKEILVPRTEVYKQFNFFEAIEILHKSNYNVKAALESLQQHRALECKSYSQWSADDKKKIDWLIKR